MMTQAVVKDRERISICFAVLYYNFRSCRNTFILYSMLKDQTYYYIFFFFPFQIPLHFREEEAFYGDATRNGRRRNYGNCLT